MRATKRAYFFTGVFVGMGVLALFLLTDPTGARFEQFPATSISLPAPVEVQASPTPTVEVKGKHCQQVFEVQDGPAWQYNGLATFQCGHKEITVSKKVLDKWLESTTRIPNNVANDGLTGGGS